MHELRNLTGGLRPLPSDPSCLHISPHWATQPPEHSWLFLHSCFDLYTFFCSGLAGGLKVSRSHKDTCENGVTVDYVRQDTGALIKPILIETVGRNIYYVVLGENIALFGTGEGNLGNHSYF